MKRNTNLSLLHIVDGVAVGVLVVAKLPPQKRSAAPVSLPLGMRRKLFGQAAAPARFVRVPKGPLNLKAEPVVVVVQGVKHNLLAL